ncbi:protein TsetseEP [Drosophila hydei]|uniref:Protein TsetseEP n=1 Tax=Drosophila hydei TaxID=7224 RepID=A0A6J1M735_DROHY|nr:protein TsetseEP [Drosophila hydei]
MFTKVCVLLLAIGLSQAVRQPMLPESNLMQFMMRSRDLTQDNPARSLSCFDTYLPQLNKANEDFQTAYALCLSEADASRAGIDEGTKGERAQIDGSATSACQALDACSKLSPSIDYFSCYSDAGADNTKSMYEISANAAEWLAIVREEFRQIDNTEYACTNKTQRNHVEQSAAIYENFDRCLAGKEPLTTASPPESTPEPSTAAPPAESTPEPSTAAPPAESTPEPSTAAPPAESTPEPSTAAPPAESTPEPSTAAPPAESTAAPSESTPAAMENMPEEDLSRLSEEQKRLKHMMDEMKNWFKRN